MAGALVAFARRMTREAFLASLRIASPVLVVVDKPPLMPVTEEQVARWPPPPAALIQDLHESGMPRAQRPPISAARMVRTFRWRKHQHDPRPIEASSTGSGLTAFVPGEGHASISATKRIIKGPMGLDSTYVCLCQLPPQMADGSPISPDAASRLRGCSFLHVAGSSLPSSWSGTDLTAAMGQGPSSPDAATLAGSVFASSSQEARSQPIQGLVWLLDAPNTGFVGGAESWDWSGHQRSPLGRVRPGEVSDPSARQAVWDALATRPRADDASAWLGSAAGAASLVRQRLRVLRLLWPLQLASSRCAPPASKGAAPHRARAGRSRLQQSPEAIAAAPDWTLAPQPPTASTQHLDAGRHMWTARDADVAATMPSGHWLVTVASTSGCGRFAVVAARRSRVTPFGAGPGPTESLSALGLRVIDVNPPSARPHRPPSLHPALTAVLQGSGDAIIGEQQAAARASLLRGSACLQPLRDLHDWALPEDCYAVLEAPFVDWDSGQVTPPAVDKAGGKRLRAERTSALAGAVAPPRTAPEPTPEQLVRDGAVFAREAVHCCSMVVYPKLQRAVSTPALAGHGTSRVQIQWAGLQSRLSAVPGDMAMRAARRFDVSGDALAGLVRSVAGADRAAAGAHRSLCEQRLRFLQRQLDARRLGGAETGRE